ncbi:HNH endonuclease [Nocardioides dongxiaopingii]|uniref:HNH endonuclease n=1 Tax=Nocardioides dongxiaopingii TaxID=2576036 RepID=UPI0010C7660A
MGRAGGRCEGSLVLLWGRCSRPAEEADHVYPWSRGGATVSSNGQALCHRCNRSKANTRPAWWYIVGLERRRRTYFPPGCDVRVSAAMSAADRRLRSSVPRRRPARNH